MQKTDEKNSNAAQALYNDTNMKQGVNKDASSHNSSPVCPFQILALPIQKQYYTSFDFSLALRRHHHHYEYFE